MLQSWQKCWNLLPLVKYDPTLYKSSQPPFPPFNVALSGVESLVVTQHCVGGRGALNIKIVFQEINLS